MIEIEFYYGEQTFETSFMSGPMDVISLFISKCVSNSTIVVHITEINVPHIFSPPRSPGVVFVVFSKHVSIVMAGVHGAEIIVRSLLHMPGAIDGRHAS